MRKLHLIAAVVVLSFLSASCVKDIIEDETGNNTTIENPDPEPEPQPEPEPEPEPEPDPDPGSNTPLLPSWKKVSSFPVIRITTDKSASIRDRVTKVPGTLRFEDPDKMYSDTTVLEERMWIRGRGNTSWSNPKKGYRFKMDVKHHVFGMKGDKDWDLLAEYSDATLLRNTVSMQISRLCGMHWTPDSRFAEVYLNGSYIGLYTIFEHKETGVNKVNVEPGTADDGDFYVELDQKDDSAKGETSADYFWTRTFYKKIKFKEPDTDEISPAQKKYIEDYINLCEETLLKDDFSQETGYPSLLDVPSFINNYIVQELTKNPDGNMRLSTFFCKKKGGKLMMPNVWDFDLAIGNCNYFTSDWQNNYGIPIDNGPTGWFVRYFGGYPCGYGGQYEYPNKQDGWYQHMYKDPAFIEALKARWEQVYPRLQSIPEYIDALAALNADAYTRNNSKWTSNRYSSSQLRSLKEFYTTRLEWMNTEIRKL